MFVTLEVSQLLRSSLNDAHAAEHALPLECAQNNWFMSVIRETSHPLIGPYVALAACGLLHQASRATSSAAWSAKTCWAIAMRGCTRRQITMRIARPAVRPPATAFPIVAVATTPTPTIITAIAMIAWQRGKGGSRMAEA